MVVQRSPTKKVVLRPSVTSVKRKPVVARMKTPAEVEGIWLDYVSELVREARAEPAREATTVVIGIHPFVIGTPDGAAALRRVLTRFKTDDAVWLTDTESILKIAEPK